MGRYALSQRSGETYDAAGKAIKDVYTLLGEKNFKIIWSMPKSCNKYLKILDILYLAYFLMFRAGKKDYIFYCIPENDIKIKMISKLRKLRHYQSICFINDLNAFRYGVEATAGGHIQAEASLVGKADYVIVPNVNTMELLHKYGVTADMIPVGVWDYLMTPEQEKNILDISSDRQNKDKEQGGLKIAFAGNLNKSEFLFVMDKPGINGISLELWGKLGEQKKEQLPSFCNYHGVLASEEIPQAIADTDYGLVWDGSGMDEIQGGLGEYLQYNNSHKCGLYLASGIPVIVWSKSGMADFVNKNKCGLCIDRLSDLSEQLTAADYNELKANALRVAKNIRRGVYLNQALDKVLETL